MTTLRILHIDDVADICEVVELSFSYELNYCDLIK